VCTTPFWCIRRVLSRKSHEDSVCQCVHHMRTVCASVYDSLLVYTHSRVRTTIRTVYAQKRPIYTKRDVYTPKGSRTHTKKSAYTPKGSRTLLGQCVPVCTTPFWCIRRELSRKSHEDSVCQCVHHMRTVCASVYDLLVYTHSYS